MSNCRREPVCLRSCVSAGADLPTATLAGAARMQAALYNIACCRSRLGDIDNGLVALAGCVEQGEWSRELDSIHGTDAGWRSLPLAACLVCRWLRSLDAAGCFTAAAPVPLPLHFKLRLPDMSPLPLSHTYMQAIATSASCAPTPTWNRCAATSDLRGCCAALSGRRRRRRRVGGGAKSNVGSFDRS